MSNQGLMNQLMWIKNTKQNLIHLQESLKKVSEEYEGAVDSLRQSGYVEEWA